MACFQGPWRMDLMIMFLYQMTLFMSVQLLFTIFLEYMPTTYCNEEDFCYKMRSKCLTNYDRNAENLCPMNSSSFDTCVNDKKKIYFKSAQLEYQQDCTDLVLMSSSTVTFLGTLFGNIILGYLSDKIGRRPVYMLSVFIGVPSIILSAAIPGLLPFYIFRGLVGFAVAGTLTVGWTYGSEMITPSRRFRLRTFPNWANARMMQVVVAYLAGEWRLTSYLCAALATSIVPMLYFLPESPVFLEQKRQYERADKARARIAAICNVEHEPKEYGDDTPLKKVTPAKLFRSPVLRTNFIVLCVMWFYVGTSVYITDLNGGDMSKNFYVGQFFSGLVLTVSKITIGILEPKLQLGRRTVFLAAQGVALLTYIIILIALYTNNKTSLWYTITYTISYASQSICLETCYVSLAELMPTDVRNTAGSITNILMKLGTILASNTKPLKFWYEPGLFWINLILCSCGGAVVLIYLPESRNVNLQLVGQDDISDDESEEIEKTEKSVKRSSQEDKPSTSISEVSSEVSTE